MNVKKKDPGQSFMHIPLIAYPEVLLQLKNMITLDPIGQITKRTGIPPHVDAAVQVSKLMKISTKLLDELKVINSNVAIAVDEAIEKKALENGRMTSEKLKELFEQYQNQLETLMTGKIKSLRNDLLNRPCSGDFRNSGTVGVDRPTEPTCLLDDNETEIVGETRYTIYNHSGKLGLHVPASVKFPERTKLRNAWDLWWLGTITSDGPVRPFRYLKREFLPKALQPVFDVNWAPILRLMEESLALEMTPHHLGWLDDAFEEGLAYVKTKASYIWLSRSWETLTVSSWSMKIRRSEIFKHGTNEDKSRVAIGTTGQQKAGACKKRHRPLKQTTLVVRRS